MWNVFLLLFVFITTIISCDKRVETTEGQLPTVEIRHCANEVVNGNALQICFDSLIADSRCPMNARCVWQGEATVKLSLQIGANEKQAFKLSTLNNPPTFRNDTTISGYKIQLLKLSPYPGDGSNNPYRVEISVSR